MVFSNHKNPSPLLFYLSHNYRFLNSFIITFNPHTPRYKGALRIQKGNKMRHKNETATSFNELREITQAIQGIKNCAQTSDNANTSEITSQSAPKPKKTAHAKNNALKPTKRAFSERQRTTIRDNSQASSKESQRGR